MSEAELLSLDEALRVFEAELPQIEELPLLAYAESKKPTAKHGTRFLVESWVYQYEVESITNRYKRLLWAIKNYKSPKKEEEALHIDRAREYPIENLLPPLVRGWCCCPLHNEKSPSFKVKNNKFNCYGCGAFGDVIDLYMKLHSSDFKTAVKALT
jgi:hypothetical protein